MAGHQKTGPARELLSEHASDWTGTIYRLVVAEPPRLDPSGTAFVLADSEAFAFAAEVVSSREHGSHVDEVLPTRRRQTTHAMGTVADQYWQPWEPALRLATVDGSARMCTSTHRPLRNLKAGGGIHGSTVLFRSHYENSPVKARDVCVDDVLVGVNDLEREDRGFSRMIVKQARKVTIHGSQSLYKVGDGTIVSQDHLVWHGGAMNPASSLASAECVEVSGELVYLELDRDDGDPRADVSLVSSAAADEGDCVRDFESPAHVVLIPPKAEPTGSGDALTLTFKERIEAIMCVRESNQPRGCNPHACTFAHTASCRQTLCERDGRTCSPTQTKAKPTVVEDAGAFQRHALWAKPQVWLLTKRLSGARHLGSREKELG